MPCPNCKGGDLTERSRFKAVAEPMDREPATLNVDVVSCESCGFSFPSIRGRKKYSLVPPERLSALRAELEEAKLKNSEMVGTMQRLAQRSRALAAEIQEFNRQSEVSVLEARVESLEAMTRSLESRRAKLRESIELMAAGIRAGPAGAPQAPALGAADSPSS